MPFLTEVSQRLVDQGVGALGTTIFVGSASVIPTGSGPYLTVSETGGSPPTRIQNQSSAATQCPTAQVLVRALTEQAARAMISAAYVALDGIYNTLLSDVFYLKLVARQEPTDMGLDGSGRIQFVFNIEAEKQPS
jgi:hypothetical protein